MTYPIVDDRLPTHNRHQIQKVAGMNEPDPPKPERNPIPMRANYRSFEWVNRRVRLVGSGVLLIVLTLGVTASVVANTDEPSFEPSGEVFDLYSRANSTLDSPSTIAAASFIVEAADGGDVLTGDAFREWQEATDRIRTDPEHTGHLVTQFDPNLGSEVPGVLSIVDLVEEQLPGGLKAATDEDVKAALARVLDPVSSTGDMRFTLSELARADDGIWTAPAFLTQVTYDHATFDTYIDSELWLREVQADLRMGAVHTSSIGVGIDFDQTFEEALQASSPFIFMAVALIVLLVAAVHRSYWSAVLVASGLGLTMLAYNGVAALAGLKMGSVLLAFIVPIAMISFGVDFFIHGSGRVREMQVDGSMTRKRAYPAGRNDGRVHGDAAGGSLVSGGVPFQRPVQAPRPSSSSELERQLPWSWPI